MGHRLELLALGNALVDVEFSVSDEELAATGLQKGTMTLVDAPTQQALLRWLLQRHTGRLTSGGSAANTVAAFAQFGGRAGFISVLGRDEHGEFFAEDFDQLGIELFAERIAGVPTGTCVVLVTPDAERTMQTSLGANECFERRMVDLRWLDYADWLYVEGYKLTSEQGALAVDEALARARRIGVHTAMSLSDVFVVRHCRDVIQSLLPKLDLLFCNNIEACAFTGAADAEDAWVALRELVPNVVVTLGAEGSLVHVEGVSARIPAYAATVVDTNGAGDMYAGAFLYALLHGWDVEQAGHLASRAAARIVEQYGARYRGNHRELVEEAATIYRPLDASPLGAVASGRNDANTSAM